MKFFSIIFVSEEQLLLCVRVVISGFSHAASIPLSASIPFSELLSFHEKERRSRKSTFTVSVGGEQ